MATKDTFENMARNAWLAGLGSIESSLEVLGKSIDTAQKKSNKLYNEFVARGEEIQNKINHKKDDIEAKGKKFFGINSQESNEEKLAQLNATVDRLTTVVVMAIEKRNAASSVVQPTARVTAKTTSKATDHPSDKTTVKTATKAKPKATAKTTTKAKPTATAKKTASKATAKAKTTKKATKTATKPETKAVTEPVTKASSTKEP